MKKLIILVLASISSHSFAGPDKLMECIAKERGSVELTLYKNIDEKLFVEYRPNFKAQPEIIEIDQKLIYPTFYENVFFRFTDKKNKLKKFELSIHQSFFMQYNYNKIGTFETDGVRKDLRCQFSSDYSDQIKDKIKMSF